MLKLSSAFAFLLLFSSFAQAQPAHDSSACFHDDLLDRLVGNWTVHSVAHGFASTAKIDVKWVLGHQHLRVHFLGNEPVPWIGAPMEFEYFIGYKHSEKKYVVHGMSVFGDDDYEGFCYAYRKGNELDLMQKNSTDTDTTIIQRFTWNPKDKTWTIKSWDQVGNNAGEVFLDMKLDPVETAM